MEKNFKSRTFIFAFWIMIFFLIGDTIDTIYRTVNGFINDGISFPGVDLIVKPTNIDLFVFVLLQITAIYGIYLLYKLKKIGGYWFIFSNLLFLIYAKIYGPISEVSITIIFPMLILYFGIYIILAIALPLFYKDNFE